MSWLSVQNHWWREGRVKPEFAKEFKRVGFAEVEELMKVRQMVVISGLRRVGKSTIMMQAIQRLIDSGVDPLDVVYSSFDERVEDLREVLKSYSQSTGRDYESRRVYVFLDEVQKLDGWAHQVKLLYDSLPNLKVILSGSAALSLEGGAKSVLAGRAFYVNMKPLSFKEFIALKHRVRVDPATLGAWEDRLVSWFVDYLRRPLPEMVEMPEGLLRRYVRESIVDRVVYRDLSEVHGRIDHNLVKTLLDLFLTSPGYYLNVDALARDLRSSKKTILDALRMLEESYLVRLVRNYRASTLASSRKLRRIYPYHFCLVSNEPIEEPKLAESVVASVLDASLYWREGVREVDFVVGREPVEVKWKGGVSSNDWQNVRYFLRKHDVERGFVVTRSENAHVKRDRKTLVTIPLWRLAFQEGLTARR